jgi:uncharacterized protein (TIGR02118 family)
MIKVSFYYPYRENGRFDVDYYCDTHMPFAVGKFGAASKGWSVDIGLSGVAPDSPPPFVVAGHLLFDSVEAFRTAVAPHVKAFADDLPNYSDGAPATVQISEVRAGG